MSTELNIQHFDDLLRAAHAMPEAQQLLFVFAGAELPAHASAQQQAEFEAGMGGELAPLMCVDKPATALHSFDALAAEAATAGPPWAIVFSAALSGRNGAALKTMAQGGPPRRPAALRPQRQPRAVGLTAELTAALKPAMPDELLQRLRRFHDHTFPGVQDTFENLVKDGQHPTILFIGCSDSRLVPYLLTGTGPGDLFLVRNVGAFVPPHDGQLPAAQGADTVHGANPETAPRLAGFHGTAAAIEFAVLNLKVTRIVVCGHSHCGGIRALYEGVPSEATNLAAWLELGREAVLPVQLSPEALRRTEQRAVVLQLERLMGYPMVRERVEAGRLTLHGWHYVIEDGEVHVFDVRSGAFVAASLSEHSGTGPYVAFDEPGAPEDIGADGHRA